jgi:hypothetical protein
MFGQVLLRRFGKGAHGKVRAFEIRQALVEAGVD